MKEIKRDSQTGYKSPDQSVVVRTELILPAMANLLNNLQGGEMMQFMDIAGALTCRRHSGCEVTTVSVDRIEFKYPVKVGEIVTVTSRLIWVGTSSMKVRICAISENHITGETKLTNTAYFTYVALGEGGRPVPVPRLHPLTEEEQAVFDREEQNHQKRKAEPVRCDCE